MLEACGASSSSGTSSTPGATDANGTPLQLLAGPIDSNKARPGGSLAIGTWSEVNALSPPQARWDSTGYLYGNALFDTLVQIGADGLAHPHLAKSVTPNADHTSFSILLRPGLVFHSGAPCDAAAVVNSLEAVVHGYITGQSLKPITSITSKGTDTVVVNASEPWPAFPSYLAGQLGYICSPKMLASANQGATTPDGTGPFSLVDWTPSSHLIAKRNPRYWQKSPPTSTRSPSSRSSTTRRGRTRFAPAEFRSYTASIPGSSRTSSVTSPSRSSSASSRRAPSPTSTSSC